jgi:hypothetical protein
MSEQRRSAMREDRRFGAGHDVAWEQLLAAEPRLAWLLADVRAARRANGDESELEGIWGTFKDRIADLVSWHRRHGEPLLRTQEAYRTAYDMLLSVLYGDLDWGDPEGSTVLLPDEPGRPW